MKKIVLQRALLGIPLGICLGFAITILISLIIGNGEYLPVPPQLVLDLGNEINAVLVQTLLCGILGAGFAAASVIWEMEDWSLVKQTGLYFLISSLLMIPVAWLANWMEHNFRGFVIYFGIFLILFVIIWLIQYLFIRENIKKMNAKITK